MRPTIGIQPFERHLRTNPPTTTELLITRTVEASSFDFNKSEESRVQTDFSYNFRDHTTTQTYFSQSSDRSETKIDIVMNSAISSKVSGRVRFLVKSSSFQQQIIIATFDFDQFDNQVKDIPNLSGDNRSTLPLINKSESEGLVFDTIRSDAAQYYERVATDEIVEVKGL